MLCRPCFSFSVSMYVSMTSRISLLFLLVLLLRSRRLDRGSVVTGFEARILADHLAIVARW